MTEETPESPPAQPRRRLGAGPAILIGLLAVFLGVAGLVVWGVNAVVDAVPGPGDLAEVVEPEPYEEIGPAVVRSVRDLSNLTTVELVEYTIVEKGVDGGFLDWATGDSLQLFAVATIGAGIDLGEVTVRSFEVDDEGVVEVTIPSAEIQYIAVDNEATQILDRETGLFTGGDPRLETDARQVAEDVLAEAAIQEGILETAETNAEEVITNFLLSLGYRDVIVEIE